MAACTSSVNLDAFSALATGSTISPASSSLFAGLSIMLATPSAAFKSPTKDFVDACAVTFALGSLGSACAVSIALAS